MQKKKKKIVKFLYTISELKDLMLNFYYLFIVYFS